MGDKMSATNDDLVRMLGEMRNEATSSRDAVMTRLGAQESALKTLTDGLTSVRAIAERAEATALEAKRAASNSVHDFGATTNAITAHIEQMQSEIAKQSTSTQAEVIKAQNELLLEQNKESERKRQARERLWKIWGPIAAGFFVVVKEVGPQVLTFLADK